MEQPVTAHRSFLRRKLVDPVFGLLRRGVTPQRLAWSLAAGFVIGVNPLFGSTTVLALLVAYLFRLNLVASQIVNHLVYPLQFVLFLVFIRSGNLIFRTAPLPLKLNEVVLGARTHPWDTTRTLWTWEWHALIAWLLFAAIAAPTLAFLLTPALEKALIRVHRREQRRAQQQAVAQD